MPRIGRERTEMSQDKCHRVSSAISENESHNSGLNLRFSPLQIRDILKVQVSGEAIKRWLQIK